MSCGRRSLLAAVAGLALVLTGGGFVHADDVAEAVLKAEQQRIAAIAKASQSTISVFARGGRGGGSGVVITADGYALTNYHVSKPAGDHMKCSLPDGNLYDAVIVGIDPTGDVALIKLLGRDDFPAAELGNSDDVRVGDWCFAVGNPFLLATDFQPTVTYGIVSGVHRYQYPSGTLLEYADCIQTDAAINPGNSGGPLFNADGQLIGINGRGSFEKRGRVNVGVGYAISINQIKNFMGYLRSGRIVDHATLGATVSSDEDGRVVVSNILELSDAARRGLQYGDEVIAFGGRPVSTVNAFKNVLGIFPKGWRVPISFVREGRRYDTLVRLEGVHGDDELIDKIQQPARPQQPRPRRDGDDPPMPDDPEQPPPMPIPVPGAQGQQPVPDEVAQFIKKRRGYTNYYFNELNRDRVWNALTAKSDFSALVGTWTISAELDNGAPVEFSLSDKQVTASLPGGAVSFDPNEDLGSQLAPAGSGGLVVAMHLWRRMLIVGPSGFGDVYYLGTTPIPTEKGLADVLIATHKVVESRFMFDPATGHLVGLEMYPDVDVDPCEIYFSDYRDVAGRMMPHRLEVRHGDQVFWIMQINKFDLAQAAEKDA